MFNHKPKVAMRKLLKTLAHSVGYDIIRYAPPAPIKPFDLWPLLVRDRLTRTPEFTFVQVGANDGVELDTLRELVVEHQLVGLLIEPIPSLFEQLRANYRGHDQLKFEQCAIGSENGTGTLYRIKPDAPLPKWTSLLASFDKAHLYKKIDLPNPDRFIEAMPVPTRTLLDVLKRHGMSDPTLLVIDVEGFDGEVVRMTLDSGIRPAIIQYEWEHLPRREQSDCKRRLVEAGYHFVDVGTDTVAILKA